MKVRPTQAKIKKCIFDVLSGMLEGKIAVDFFAGTGSLGIEALRRGVKKVVFVEKDRRHRFAIKKALKDYMAGDIWDVWVMDVFKALPIFKKRKFLFDIFFADPPYGYGYTAEFLGHLFCCGILDRRAKGVVEHSRHILLPDYPSFKKWKEKRFGETMLTFYGGDIN